MEMMQQNIHNHKLNQEKRIKIDKATDHLLNPVTFQMMYQAEKMRDLHVKEKKLTDDTINKKTMFQRKLNQNQKRREDRRRAQSNEESFFERLRRIDAQREAAERKEQLQKRNKMAYAAAYADGECLINTCTADDYAKMDEANANKIMEQNNQREDKITLEKTRAHK